MRRAIVDRSRALDALEHRLFEEELTPAASLRYAVALEELGETRAAMFAGVLAGAPPKAASNEWWAATRAVCMA